MGKFPKAAIAPRAMKLIHRAALRSRVVARVSWPTDARPDDVVGSAPMFEILEPRQMLSASVPSRDSLSKLHSSLQSTYQEYKQFIAAQPVESAPTRTRQERASKALAISAVSAAFEPVDASSSVSGGDISIEAFANPGDLSLLKSALKKLSGQTVTATGRQVDATLPVADLGTLASLKSLRFAEADSAVANVGAVTSQGDIADQAASARTGYGINGAGIKIGIISDSFNNNNQGYTDTYSTDVASGDLPSGVTILNDNYPGTDEGRAIAQVIYDSAPGVTFAFASGEGGQSNMASEIYALEDVGCNIIVDDITYENEPMFTDGVIAQAAESAVANGVTYISAAGNLGSSSYASAWRSGPTLSSGSIAKDSTALNAPSFYGGVTFNFNSTGGTNDTESFTLGPGQSFNPSLQWDSPYYSAGGLGTSNQVDFYVLNAAGNLVEGGSAALVTGGDPIQNFSFKNPSTTSSNTYNLMICCSIGPVPGYIKYVDFATNANSTEQATNWQFPQNSSTIFGHANAAGVESVGAVNYANTPAFNVSTPVLESYSGTGGTPIILTTTGTSLKPYVYRQSPEVVAPDAVSTTFFKQANSSSPAIFSGTSAAAAEVAGLTALLLQKDPKFTPAQVDSAINTNTIKMGTTSPNNQSGYGLVQALPIIASSVGNITGTVFYDLNGNGVADQGEVGISGAIVYIDEFGSGFLQEGDPETTSGVNGAFEFYNQSVGSTVVRLVPLSGYVQTDGAQTVNVSGGTTSSGIYFGLFPVVFAGYAGNYNYLLQNNVAQPGILNIYINGTITYSAPLSILQSSGLTFNLEGGNSSLTTNFTFGDPIPVAGVDFTPTGSGNSLIINGSSGVDTGVVDNDVTSFDAAPASGGSSITADGIQNETINGNGGNDNFTIATAPPVTEILTFNGSNTVLGNTTLQVSDVLKNNGTGTFFNAGTFGGDQNTLNVSAGVWTFAGNPAATSSNLTVNLGSINNLFGNVVFAAGGAGSGLNTRQLAALNIGAGSLATVAAPDGNGDRAVLVLSTLTIASAGILDLSGNDMILTTGNLTAISTLIGSGYNNGAWNGTGIQSTAAAANTSHVTALGVIVNNANGTRIYGTGTPLGTFDGMNVSSSAILVKYTYYGDANLSGIVDGSDYSLVDNGYTAKLTGWYNGDFNYDRVVNGSDYTLLDNAFNMQGPGL